MSLIPATLEAFGAVVRCKTVHAAAREIGVTQTAITQRIKGLERELGVTLFTRSRSGMRLTGEGEALYRYYQRVRDMVGELAASLSLESPDESVRLVVTGPSSIMRARVIPRATAVLAAFSSVAFTFDLDDDESGIKALKTGRAQLAVVPRSEVVAELDSKLLSPLRHSLFVCPAWAKRKISDIVEKERIVDFNDHDDATFSYLARLKLLDRARKERHLANNIDALAAIVAAGHGYSVLLDDFAAPLLASGALVALSAPGRPRSDWALAWYPRANMPGYLAEVIKSIR